ncbi:MAG: MoaD/ThiS family protein [Ignavibacteria bacterium]|nr:MoaD/ThiS family protein [Ignavibacteria bacterium]
MKVKVLYFGVTADITGKEQELIAEAKDLNSLRAILTSLYPGLKNANFRFAVNLKLINDINSLTLNKGDEVALLPPFAGG